MPSVAPAGAPSPGPTSAATSAPTSTAAAAASSITPAAPRRGEPITLNFAGAEIEAVARTLGAVLGRNVVVDPRVKGLINLSTERPVSPAVAYQQFLATIRLQGFTVVESAGLDKVVPEADAKLQSESVIADPGSSGPSGNRVVTQIFRLQHEQAANLVPVLRPLISPNNIITVNPGNNALIVTDYADNLRRIARIVASVDVANATDVEVIPLRHALASELAPLVLRLIESGGASAPLAGQADTSYKTTLLAEPRSNAIIVRAANAARVSLVRSLVEKLDRPASGGGGDAGNIHVVYLKNADASKLAATLRAAIAGEARGGTSGSSASMPATPSAGTPAGTTGGTATSTTMSGTSTNLGSSAQPSTGGQIQADPATNSLIISAPEPQMRQIRAVIDKLDQRRAQVLVESLIAEVNADKAAEFGIQWQGALGKSGNSNIGLLGTNFTIGGRNIISLATGAATGTSVPSTGLNFGIAHQTNGVYVLGFLARFLENNGDGNVLSTPNLLTLDNEEAKIVIGQNVPFVTGQYTANNASGGGTVNPFQTIERRDVGLTLRVKPQISENGTVRLAIFQEVSSVLASTINNAQGPTTSKRSIESNVLVEDGAVVVLGGLLQDEYSGNQEKVPALGDIPLLGNLFRSETRQRKKTNLMVFLRPVVLRDAASAEQLSMDRYDLMRVGQQAAQPAPSQTVPVNAAPVLPAAGPSRNPSQPLLPISTQIAPAASGAGTPATAPGSSGAAPATPNPAR